jgi:hypothetical protein
MAFEKSQNWCRLLAEVFVAFDPVLGNTIVDRFSEALLRDGCDRWNLEVQARNYTPTVALGTLQPLRIEEKE